MKTLLLVQFSILLAIEAVVCFTPLGSVPLAPPLIVATLGMIPVVIAAVLLGPKAGTLMGFFAGLFSFIVWTFIPPSPLMAFVFSPFYSIGDIHGNALSLVICFVPRMLVGLVAGALYTLFKRTIIPGKTPRFIVFGIATLVISLLITVLAFILGYVIVVVVLHQSPPPIVTWVLLAIIFIACFAVFYRLLERKLAPETAANWVIYGVSAIVGSMMNTIFVLGGIYIFFGRMYAESFSIAYDTLIGIIGMSVVTNGIPEAALAAVCTYFIAGAIIRKSKLSRT